MNLRTDNVFVGRFRSNIYSLWIKYYQKYIQEDIHSVLLLTLHEGSLKGDANSHLFRSLWDQQKVHNIRIEKVIYILASPETNSHFHGRILQCLPLGQGYRISKIILQQPVPNTKFMECLPPLQQYNLLFCL